MASLKARLEVSNVYEAFNYFGETHLVSTTREITVHHFDEAAHKQYIFKIIKELITGSWHNFAPQFVVNSV